MWLEYNVQWFVASNNKSAYSLLDLSPLVYLATLILPERQEKQSNITYKKQIHTHKKRNDKKKNQTYWNTILSFVSF